MDSVLATAILCLLQTPMDRMVEKLDALVQKRDVEGLTPYLALFKGRNPLGPIQTGGAYGTGRFGWRAMLLRMGSQSFVVFTTPLTSEDIGELLFRFDGAGKLVYVPEAEANGDRIKSHRFVVSFDLAKKQARITDTIVLQNIGRRTLPPMLRIGPNYRIQSVVDREGQPVAFLQAGGIVCFPGLGVNETLTLRYVGTVDHPQYAGSIDANHAMLTNDSWYPTIARRPAPYTLTVITPAAWIPVGQGEQVSEKVDGAQKTTTFRMDMPVSYYSFSAAAYRTVSKTIGGRKFTIWSDQLTDEQMAMQCELYAPIVKFYERFAPYPFTRWGAVIDRPYGGGALEAYSFATYGSGLPGEDGHETAHTWWGGMVDNSYLHSLWNESFADFSQNYYLRNVSIGSVTDRQLAFVATPEADPAYKVAAPSQASPFIGEAASNIGYGKGAYVLQMLEQELGSPTMLKAMQEWQKTQPKDRSGEWEDFEAAVARVSKEDMRWFFQQWIDRAGYPEFDVPSLEWRNGRLVGRIKFSGEPYILNADVLIRDRRGERIIRAKLSTDATKSEQQFLIACPERPSLVSIDPWRRILRPIRPDETPTQISTSLSRMTRYTDPKHPQDIANMRAGRTTDTAPTNPAGMFLVGRPSSLPMMAELCQRVGFKVQGEALTYRGTTIDLRKGGAVAVVDLGGGKECMIGLGVTRLRPSVGRARVALVDEYGRFLRGETEPKRSGFLTFHSF